MDALSSTARPITRMPLPKSRPRRTPSQRLCRGPRLAAREGLDHPAPELVTVGVVEPPHVLAWRVDRAVERAFLAIRQLPFLVRGAIPGVQLPGARLVRRVQQSIRLVIGPLRAGWCAARGTAAARLLRQPSTTRAGGSNASLTRSSNRLEVLDEHARQLARRAS